MEFKYLIETTELDNRVRVLRQKITKLDDFGYKNGYDREIVFDNIKDTVENHLMKYRDELVVIYDSPEFFEEDELDLDEALGLREDSYKDNIQFKVTLRDSDTGKLYTEIENVKSYILQGDGDDSIKEYLQNYFDDEIIKFEKVGFYSDDKDVNIFKYNDRLKEDTIKQNGKWVNKGKEGTHGTFKTKKAADAQRKAMFANGFKESVDSRKLTLEEVRQIALDNYENGGDVIVEAWTDEDILMWIDEHGTKEELFDLFSRYNQQYTDVKGSGEYKDLEKEDSIEIDTTMEQDYYDEEDFGPSNPWDAPGMSIKDFIR